jgi:hypothetical protein
MICIHIQRDIPIYITVNVYLRKGEHDGSRTTADPFSTERIDLA